MRPGGRSTRARDRAEHATSAPAPLAADQRRHRTIHPHAEARHLFRAPIDDGGALAMESTRFRDIFNHIRPHQALGDGAPRTAYLGSS